MTIRTTACPAHPDAHVRRRIVDIAVQEWAFFGFTVVDQTGPRQRLDRRAPERSAASGRGQQPGGARRRIRWLNAEESARVAATIAGYWAATPEGGWILENQNKEWNGPDGVAARWRDPWSAAFISWVACESGLGSGSQFQRAIAHHKYIDQAIRARDGRDSTAAYVAYDIGERDMAPGDLLCSGRRPDYRSLADRRRQMGDGARTHCDLVVQLEEQAGRVLVIGGNVRGAVSLKILPARRGTSGRFVPGRDDEEDADLFAHLQLRTPGPVERDALTRAPTMRAIACAGDVRVPSSVTASGGSVLSPRSSPATC
jgi:hypothetical protein